MTKRIRYRQVRDQQRAWSGPYQDLLPYSGPSSAEVFKAWEKPRREAFDAAAKVHGAAWAEVLELASDLGTDPIE